MTAKEILKLKAGDKVIHIQLGICTVRGIVLASTSLFGLSITPDSKEGCIKLSEWSGMPFGTPLLETSYRLLKPYK
jgi:hypothetical protein